MFSWLDRHQTQCRSPEAVIKRMSRAQRTARRNPRPMAVRGIALMLLITHLGYSLAATLAIDTHGHGQEGEVSTANSLAFGHDCASPSDPDQSAQHDAEGVDGNDSCDHGCHASAHLLGAPSEYRTPALPGSAATGIGRDPACHSRTSTPLLRPPLFSV